MRHRNINIQSLGKLNYKKNDNLSKLIKQKQRNSETDLKI